MSANSLKLQIMKDEGLRLFPYRDDTPEKVWTIGWGHNVEVDPVLFPILESLKKTGISRQQAETYLDLDIQAATNSLYNTLPWVNQLDQNRQEVLINMCFNMGILRLLSFRNTLFLIENGKYEEAADHMLQSKWHDQVGKRADRLAEIMRTGVA